MTQVCSAAPISTITCHLSCLDTHSEVNNGKNTHKSAPNQCPTRSWRVAFWRPHPNRRPPHKGVEFLHIKGKHYAVQIKGIGPLLCCSTPARRGDPNHLNSLM